MLECETRVQPLDKPKREVHVSLPERETRIEEQSLFKRDLRFSTHKCEVRIQHPKAKRSADGKPLPPWVRGCLRYPYNGSKGLLNKERSVHQITPQCCCERLIKTVLSKCHCSSHTSKPSVFNRLLATPSYNKVKTHRSTRRDHFLTWSILM